MPLASKPSARLLHRDEEAQDVKFLYRRLKLNPTVNVRRFAHWALQVGDYIYELAEPADATLAREMNNEFEEELRRRTAREEDFDDHEEWFAQNTQQIRVIPGKVPLQISKINAWQASKVNKGFGEVVVSQTRLSPDKIMERAIHIFHEVFEYNYDILYNNCQAFACFLCLSIALLTPPGIKLLISAGSPDPRYEQRHHIASIYCWAIWRLILGTFPDEPFDPRVRRWTMIEKAIDYEKVLPPQAMEDLLNPRTRRPSKQPRTRRASHQHVPKSHAVHAVLQAHEDLMQNLDTVLVNAVTAQQSTLNGIHGHKTHKHASHGHAGHRQSDASQQFLNTQLVNNSLFSAPPTF
ncbi:MAG: hypothetical protein Q9159_007413 [Coniocarpon cinnabarinum]